MKRAAALLLALAACARGGHQPKAERDLLTPRFAPEATTTTVAGAGGATTTPAGRGAPVTTQATTMPPAQVRGPVVAGATTAAVTDPLGDLTPSPTDPPPPWADLAGATLLRRADGFELRVRLGGDAAPTRTDEDHTMNIASYYDVDGDGSPDYEVWANLADSGWGSSWFDNRSGRRAYAERSGVAVTVSGAEVVLRFPLSHLGDAERFRWSLASEWGRNEVLGTPTTARDDMPDNDAAARFPG